MNAAVYGVIVLIGRGWGRRRGCGVSLSGGVVLRVRVIDEGDVGF